MKEQKFSIEFKRKLGNDLSATDIEKQFKDKFSCSESVTVTEITDQPLVISEEVRKGVAEKVVDHCSILHGSTCVGCVYYNNVPKNQSCKAILSLSILSQTMQKVEPNWSAKPPMFGKVELVGAVDVEGVVNRTSELIAAEYGSYAHSDGIKSILRQFIQSNIRPKIELPMVETGTLKTPAEITGCDKVTRITWNKGSINDSYTIGEYDYSMRRDLKEFPREFYKDIQSTVVYSKIPVGSVVEVEYLDQKYVGYFTKYENSRVTVSKSNTLWSNDLVFSSDKIKSIGIIAEGK